jgi:two-component system, NarL family, nitrate/nitrite response regulator NarL
VIRAVVVAEVRFYRDGLAQLLAHHQGCTVAATASGPEEALAAVRDHDPDVVLLALGDATGSALVQEIVEERPGSRVVALGVAEEEDDVLALAEAGVAGYVTTDGSADDVLAVVESVARGETLCSPRIAATLLRRVASLTHERRTRPDDERLTARERQVLALIEQGLSNKEIARGLCIEVATVKNHVHNILEKLQVNRRGEAAALLRRAPEVQTPKATSI